MGSGGRREEREERDEGFKRRLWMGGRRLIRHQASPFSHSEGQTSLWPRIYLYARSGLGTERETHERHLSKY